MAASLRLDLKYLIPRPSTVLPTITGSYLRINCGPRGNRGPLLKGRVLSIEAIQAIQALKRAHCTGPSNLDDTFLSKTLSRLLKADLVAAFNELIRQDQTEIAAKVFSVIQLEYSPELGHYADLVSSLSKKGFTDEIDELVHDLEKKGKIQCDDKGLVRLVKALIEAERVGSTARIYELMKRNGWGSTFEVDDHVAELLSRGLRRMGEGSLADEIDLELKRLYKGVGKVKF
ncbi:hypothetical protein M9H77_25446 [Catharanthus roseus]|uniref:Uncharacterized protein n=1 Tax=Catharanthus roseus TaxID=4058 RepID=A0ACC0A6X5_CATRO|nr:hypothetical protein M9H77_25446 [Catharanthus roseus]